MKKYIKSILLISVFLVTSCSKSENNTAELNKSKVVDLQACVKNDSRRKVELWQPSYDEWSETLSSLPSLGDGKVVFALFGTTSLSATACNNDDLLSFRFPNDRKNPEGFGGMLVNFRGNTQYGLGVCYLSGFFMNKTIMGMHQGWVETYFEALSMKDILLGNNYCLSSEVSEPSKEVLSMLSNNDKLVTITGSEVLSRKTTNGDSYAVTYLYFVEDKTKNKLRAACPEDCESIISDVQKVSGLKAKIKMSTRVGEDINDLTIVKIVILN